ncbi:hypothetical protein PMAYCL1PPCAC_25980, partial [Pristionchus mayeri]
LHLEPIGELQHVRHSEIRDFHRSKVDEIEQIEEFLINDILDLNFLFSLLCEIMEEHCSEEGRMASQN